MNSNVVFYTKEKGQRIYLASGNSFDGNYTYKDVQILEKNCEKFVGHPITDVYAMIEGKEFKFPNAFPKAR